MYFDKSWVLEPEEVLIEGEEDVFTEPDTFQSQSTSTKNSNNPSAPIDNAPNNPAPASVNNVAKNLPTPIVSTETSETPPNTPVPPPHQRTMQQNSLAGLTPANKTQYGHGKHNCVPTSHSATNVSGAIAGVLMLDDSRSLEPGGVELDVSEEDWFNQVLETMIASKDEPMLTEALNGNKCSEWSDMIDAELSQMEKVIAWVPIIPPSDANIIPSHYVFHHKCDAMGNVAHYKAHLIIKGFRQQFGVDYIETFTPTVWASTLQILLSFAAQTNAAVHQCDVKNAYLNSPLQDGINIYSELPPKYENFHQLPPELKNKSNVVCKWLVSVYGSKQGAHDWYAKVKNFFTGLGYLVSIADKAIFYLYYGNKFTIVATATDNFTVIADSTESANHLIQKQLTKHFKISDLRPPQLASWCQHHTQPQSQNHFIESTGLH